MAGNVAETVVSGAGTVASSMLQPLVFDPLRWLQGGTDTDEIDDAERLWVAVDGMGGDHAPGPILEGCLDAIARLPLKIRFVGEIDLVMAAATSLGLREALESARAAGHLDPVASGPSIGMDDEATAVRRKRDASINVAMDLVKKGEAEAVYSLSLIHI